MNASGNHQAPFEISPPINNIINHFLINVLMLTTELFVSVSSVLKKVLVSFCYSSLVLQFVYGIILVLIPQTFSFVYKLGLVRINEGTCTVKQFIATYSRCYHCFLANLDPLISLRIFKFKKKDHRCRMDKNKIRIGRRAHPL